MIGQRGLPASFGGVERHVEELGSRLVAAGHEVIVFNRKNYVQRAVGEHRGMRTVPIPTVSTKHLDAIVHSLLSTIVAMLGSVDIVHYHALGPGLPSFLPRLIGSTKVVQTIHGLDSRRGKWGSFSRSVLRGAEWLSGRVPDATIVVSRDLAAYYRTQYGREAVYIPNGVDARPQRLPREIATKWGLKPAKYLLFVGRLVPEKAPDLLIRAFRRIPDDVRLVVVGGSSFSDGYVRRLRDLAAPDRRVLFTGYVYGPTLDELYTNAAAFVLPSLLEGLPLTLLEAAACGVPIVASDIPPHTEVLGVADTGYRLFPTGDEEALARTLREVLVFEEELRTGALQLQARVLGNYRWDEAARATEALYQAVRDPGERLGHRGGVIGVDKWSARRTLSREEISRISMRGQPKPRREG